MDIKKLQRAIVDGLEDVKGQDILVFNTEHLSPLFERVIIASGQSNRQTKALAASVRDAVKSRGMDILRVEGEENGEWIIVDCGAAVAHIMQPTIREYYRLEEIWGEKPVKIKLSAKKGGLVKASEGPADEPEEDEAPARSPSAKAPARKAAAKKAPAKKAPAKSAAKKAPARKSAGATAAAKKSPARKTAGSTGAPAKRASGGAGRKTAGGRGAREAGVQKVVVPGSTSRTATARKTAATKAAPARSAAAKAPAAKRAAPAAKKAPRRA